jgi:hypothetical protein
MKLGGGAAIAAALVLAGCAPSYVTSNDATVNLIIASINGGSPLDSNVRMGEGATPPLSFVCEDAVPVEVAVRNKNPNAPVPSVPSAVLLQSYQVSYSRTDGRGTQGVDVPYTITGNLSAAVDVADSGTSEIFVEVVRHQAKRDPPLNNIFQTTILTVNAELTLYGQTVSGQKVSASGRFQINFADFLDKLTECPPVQ